MRQFSIMPGGKRIGAGRTTRFGVSTKVIRVPRNMVDSIYSFINNDQTMQLPLYSCSVQAGFPSPADDYIEAKLNLNDYLIKNAAATFFVRVSGRSMEGCGIWDGDILIVDRSLKARHNKIVVAVLDNELTVKRYLIKDGKIFLSPENPDFDDIEISEASHITIWGVVTCVIHQFN